MIRTNALRLLAVLAVLMAGMLLLSSPAQAADEQVQTVTAITPQQLVTVLVAVIAPIVVGLVTKVSTSAGVKAIILTLITAAVGVGQGFIDVPAGETWNWQVAVFNAVLAWVVAVATYFGVLAPTGVTGKAQTMLVKDK